MQEIVVCTPEDHPDYELLITVTRDVQLMADHINEVKRRKDVVEQLISDKKKMDRNVSSLYYIRLFNCVAHPLCI